LRRARPLFRDAPACGATPKATIESRRKLALPEDDRRLVVIVAHLRIADRREGNDAQLAQRQSLCRSKRTVFGFAGDRRVGFQVSTPPVLKACTK
jgi:hypothetical protein